MANSDTPPRPKTIRSNIDSTFKKEEFILPHLLGPDGPKRQTLFKVFDSTKGPDDKANQRNLDNVSDAYIRFRMYQTVDVHFEHHRLTETSGDDTARRMSKLVREADPYFDSTSETPQPRPYCFGCSSFFHPFTSDNFRAILPIKRFQSEDASMKACSRCKVVTYCSQECQTRDWDGKVREDDKKYVSHRKICKALVKDFEASVKEYVSDPSLDPSQEFLNAWSKQLAEDMYKQRLKTWVRHHHEQILAVTRKTLDKPIFEWLPELNVTVIFLQEDDLLSPFGAIVNQVRKTSSQPEIVYQPINFFPGTTATPSPQQMHFAKFRFWSSIFHIVRVSRMGLNMLNSYLENHTPSPVKNTSNPEFDPQELINVGYHPVIFIGNLSQSGKVVHLEHIKISEIMDCDDLDYFSIARLIALTNRGNLATLKHTRQIFGE